jgi:GntR family transcriptional regulator/MocR family aminotransferase
LTQLIGPMHSGEVDLHVSLVQRGEFAAQIYRQTRDAILDGRLASGERLPPSREFAQRLGVSRNTVAVAYERLTAEGLLVARVGAGTFVGTSGVGASGNSASGDGAAGSVPGGVAARRRPAPEGHSVRPRAVWQGIPEPPRAAPTKPRFDFRVGMPDASLFPLESWRRLVNRELRASTIQSGQYGNPSGHGDLRTAIARYIGVSRSVHATADDVLVTHGAQQALDLIGRILIEPGDCVAVENPGYPPVRALFASLGARVVGVPVDGEGLNVEAIPAAARLVYTTPSHQFPLGTPMSLARRAAILAWARRRNAVVIEDDYDSEFRFSGRPLEPLQSLDRSGRVLYVGSFSKTMLPMLRIGFLVAPVSLQPALRTAKQLTDWHGDTPTQAALARFIDEGLLGRHIRRASRQYEARHGEVETALRGPLARWLDLVPSAAGLHVCARLRPNATVNVDDVLARAARSDVAVESLAASYTEKATSTDLVQGVVIGYGGIDTADIPEGLSRLAKAFRDATR